MDENQINKENSTLCPQCGAQLKSGANFCGKCGFKVRENKNSEPEKKMGSLDSTPESPFNLTGQISEKNSTPFDNFQPIFKDLSEVVSQEKEPFTPFQPNGNKPMNNSSFEKMNLNTIKEEGFAPIEQENLPLNDPFAPKLDQVLPTSNNPDPTVKNQESKKKSQTEFQNSNTPFDSINETFQTHDIENQEENLNKVSSPENSEGEIKYCNQCGTQLKANSKFCSACGASTTPTLEADTSINTKYVRKSKSGKSAATEKMNVFKSLISNVPEEEENVSPFATDLPSWNIEPPVIPVQRKRRK